MEKKLTKTEFVKIIKNEYPDLYKVTIEPYLLPATFYTHVNWIFVFLEKIQHESSFKTYDDILKYIKENEDMISFWLL